MNGAPITLNERNAGTWVETDNIGLAIVAPNNEPIIVGSLWKHRGLDAIEGQCRVCKEKTALDPRDQEVMAKHKDIVVICGPCFLELQEDN